jgi:PEP-CTERM motif
MTFRSWFALAALAGSLMLATNTAHAGYTFSANPTPITTMFGPLNGSTVSLLPTTSGGTMNGASFINIANISLASTTSVPPQNTDMTSINVFLSVTITNVPTGPGTGTPGTDTITGTGVLAFTRSDTGGELSSFTPGISMNNGANIGGVIYTLSQLGYQAPTVNSIPNGNGNFSVLITPTLPGTVPEPASMIMFGCGLVGVAGLGLRRMKKA